MEVNMISNQRREPFILRKQKRSASASVNIIVEARTTSERLRPALPIIRKTSKHTNPKLIISSQFVFVRCPVRCVQRSERPLPTGRRKEKNGAGIPGAASASMHGLPIREIAAPSVCVPADRIIALPVCSEFVCVCLTVSGPRPPPLRPAGHSPSLRPAVSHVFSRYTPSSPPAFPASVTLPPILTHCIDLAVSCLSRDH